MHRRFCLWFCSPSAGQCFHVAMIMLLIKLPPFPLSLYSSLTHWFISFLDSLVAQTVKCLPTMRETRVRSLGREDSMEKEMATHSSSVAGKIPWTEKRDRLLSMGLQRVRQD